jgi:micrococcal nuclease
MRRTLILLLILLTGCAKALPPAPKGPIFPNPHGSLTVVAKIWDGDTIETTDGHLVRLLGINCPEIGTPMGKTAAALTTKITLGRTVHLETDAQEYDDFGRLLAYVYVPESFGWSMANITLILHGLAQPLWIPPNGKYRGLFDAALADAIKHKRGLWAH